jgi:uncharacterized protein (TIGR03437 family)
MDFRYVRARLRAVLFLILTAGAAFSAPITWNFSNATFNDGGTATGYFVFDSDAGAISNWNIVTSAGSTLPAFTYTPANSTAGVTPSAGCPAPCASFASNQTFPDGTFNENRDLNLTFLTELSDAGGTVGLNLKSSDECLDCSPYRLFTQGSVQSGASPGLSVAPVSLIFQLQPGAAPQSQSVQIAGTAGTAWKATAATSTGGAWLSVSPLSGDIPASLSATANPGSLAPGIYQGSITIEAPGVSPSSVMIGVSLTVVAASGIITTVAGNGISGFSGDGGPAIDAELRGVYGVAVDASGNIYTADSGNNRIRKISAGGIITTAAGNGTASISGDGGPATTASLSFPLGVAVDASGNLFVADTYNNRVRKVSGSGVITTVAGSGPVCMIGLTCGSFAGDGGPATSASLNAPHNVAVDAAGNLFIADTVNNRIRKVSPSGTITTVAGNGPTCGPATQCGSFSGDGGAATAASLYQPNSVAVDASGNLYIADTYNYRIRKVSAGGTISTVAGNGTKVSSGDGGPATAAGLSLPIAIAVDPSGNLWIADFAGNKIRKVSANGSITTVAGNGTQGFSGDSGPATAAELTYPAGIALDSSGDFFIADNGNGRIREVFASTPSITASPASLSFSIVAGGSSQQQISLIDAAGLPWSASSSTDWISLNPTSGTTSDMISVTVDTASLQPGGYTGSITISNPLATPQQEIVSVSLTVTAAASLSVGPSALAFQVLQGAPPQSQPLQIAGTAGLDWQASATSTGAWLSVSPLSGQIPLPLTVTVTPSGLTPGVYQGSVTIQSFGATPPSITVDVTLTVTSTSGLGGIITTVAGGVPFTFPTNVTTALNAPLGRAYSVVPDSQGNIYVADSSNNLVFAVSPTGSIRIVAGNGTASVVIGDGGPATSAALNAPSGVTLDASGNLLIADSGNNRIRKVSANGIITTVAGNGIFGFSGDGGPALNAAMNGPTGIAVDASGDLYISDTYNHRIRKVSAGGVITTIVGAGTLTTLNYPRDVAVDASGNLFIADEGDSRILMLSSTGVLTTVAGGQGPFFSGDGGPATSASVYFPFGIALDNAGDLFIADYGNNRIRKVSTNGIISTVAGTGYRGFAGDGGPAASAQLNFPAGVAVDASGNLIIADTFSYRIRVVSTSGVINTVAGNGNFDFSGDGGPATSASLSIPYSVAADSSGNFFIVDTGNDRIRKVSANGVIDTVAGSGDCCFSGDGGPATSASLGVNEETVLNGILSGAASGPGGNLFFADTFNQRIRKVSPSGTITTVAGNGIPGYTGDGGPATSAEVDYPEDVAVDASGNLFIADMYRIRKVSASGTITTIAGNGKPGFSGDGGQATSAELSAIGIAVDASGNVFAADGLRVRKVSPNGIITTIAGNGTSGFSGDGGPATTASLMNPIRVALDQSGNLFILDGVRVRMVSPSGIITTVTGNGTRGFSGDGGPATTASFYFPEYIAIDASGDLLIADSGNNRIRRVSAPIAALARPNVTSVGNGASFAQSFAPGMLMSVFGTGLSTGGAQTVTGAPLPVTSSSGTSVAINGIPAPLLYISATQINLQIPYQVSPGAAVLTVTAEGQSASINFTVQVASPGIFVDAATGHIVPDESAGAGSTVALFLTGAGEVTPMEATGNVPIAGTTPVPNLPLTMTVGGIAVAPVYVGIPNWSVGVLQVNFTVPTNAGSGPQPVVVTIGGVASQAALLTVTPPPEIRIARASAEIGTHRSPGMRTFRSSRP